MKKLYLLLLITALIFTGCGDNDNEDTSKVTTESDTTTTESDTTTTMEGTTPEESSTSPETTVPETTTEPPTTTVPETTTDPPTTTQAPTTTPAPSIPSEQELVSLSITDTTINMAYYEEVLALVNEIRAEVGVAPLTLDTTLCQAATLRALEMDYNDLFSHTRPDGSSCFTSFKLFGISYMAAGENIAAGYSSPEHVVKGWKESEGHYLNMINEAFTKLGVGYSKKGYGSYGKYWVQLFTG